MSYVSSTIEIRQFFDFTLSRFYSFKTQGQSPLFPASRLPAAVQGVGQNHARAVVGPVDLRVSVGHVDVAGPRVLDPSMREQGRTGNGRGGRSKGIAKLLVKLAKLLD